MTTTQGTIRIMCPRLTCRKVLAVPASSRGRNVRCRNCGATIRIPVGNEQQQSKPNAHKPGDEDTAQPG